VYDRIERLLDGPYLELFARRRRLGWDAWGYEVAPERRCADCLEIRPRESFPPASLPRELAVRRTCQGA
jgi:N6-adenosine-specific RNA methylase IME4